MVVNVTNCPEHLPVTSETKHFIESIRPNRIHIIHQRIHIPLINY